MTVKNMYVSGTQMLNFKAVDTNFYFARILNVEFKTCSLKNVTFHHSDLTYSDLRTCNLENVKFSNSVVYGTKK